MDKVIVSGASVMYILFLTNNYYPKPLANGACIHQLAKHCVENDDKVYVICYGREGEPVKDVIEGINVYRIKVPFYVSLINTNRTKSEIVNRILSRIGILCNRIRKLINVFNYPIRDKSIIGSYVRVASKIIESNPVELVISTYTPAEAICAGALLKNKYHNIKSIYYSLDTLTNEKGVGRLPLAIRVKLGSRLEKKMFELYDSIVLMKCHKSHYSSTYTVFEPKIHYSNFPLYVPIKTNSVSELFTIVYAGSLYRVIRNPSKALGYICPNLGNYSLHFYGYSDCNDVLEDYANRFSGKVFNHGLVDYAISHNAMLESKILLSLGNSETEMFPSKIFEYMSLGKPIIHVYASPNDSCLELLRRYGNSLLLDSNQPFDKEKLISFISNARSYDMNEMVGLFEDSRPEYTVRLFKSLVY